MTRGKAHWLEAFLVGPFLLVVFFAQAMTEAQEQKIRIAAAADLQFVMQDLAAQFEQRTGTRVGVSYGSSGNLYSQLQNGAPFDLFFSADLEYPKKLEAEGLAEPGTLYSYAVGRLVIWTPRDSKVDVARDDWKAILDPRVQKIAIANPEHAPYGRAALAALQKAGIYKQVKAKLVYGENISQAAQFVQSGNAQAGIIAMALAVSPPMKDGSRWEIPPAMFPPIEQGVILMKHANNKHGARAFLEFVKSVPGREIIFNHGFALMGSGDAGTVIK